MDKFGKALPAQGGFDPGGAFVQDTRTDERTARRKLFPEHGCHADDDIGNDVGTDNLVAAADGFGKRRVAQRVAVQGAEPGIGSASTSGGGPFAALGIFPFQTVPHLFGTQKSCPDSSGQLLRW